MSVRAPAGRRRRSTRRTRVEHVLAQHGAMDQMLVQTIGVVPARFTIGTMNLPYDLWRLAWLQSNRQPALGYGTE